MNTNIPKLIVGHHTGVSRKDALKQFFAVNRYHRQTPEINLGYPSTLGYYGGYHIFFEPNGTELRYREDWEEGAHTIGHNLDSLAFCWAGNGDVEFPTDAQLWGIAARIRKWQEKYNIPNEKVFIVPHRKFANKTCYGSLLSDDWAYLLVNPIQKTSEEAKKAEDISGLVKLLDLLRLLVLKLKILLDLQQRSKEPR